MGAGLYFLWVGVIKFAHDVYKLRKIPGPVPVPILGNLGDKMALTSVTRREGVA